VMRGDEPRLHGNPIDEENELQQFHRAAVL